MAWWPQIVELCRLLSASTTIRGVVQKPCRVCETAVKFVLCIAPLAKGSMHYSRKCDAEHCLVLCMSACMQCPAHLLLKDCLMPVGRPWARW